MPIPASLTANESMSRDSQGCAANHRGRVKLRLFVAVEINESVRALALKAANALAAAGVAGKFESPEKLHVTIAFLGHVPESELANVTQALRDASAACEPFTLEFDRIGAFPSQRRPRVIWIGARKESEAFTVCARRVRTAFEALGARFDHDAAAHITVCRPKFVPSRELPELEGNASLHVRGLTLFRSLPAGPTTRYEALERTTFTGAKR